MNVLIPAELLRQLRHYTECYLDKWPSCGAPTVAEVEAELAEASRPPSPEAGGRVVRFRVLRPDGSAYADCMDIEHARHFCIDGYRIEQYIEGQHPSQLAAAPSVPSAGVHYTDGLGNTGTLVRTAAENAPTPSVTLTATVPAAAPQSGAVEREVSEADEVLRYDDEGEPLNPKVGVIYPDDDGARRGTNK